MKKRTQPYQKEKWINSLQLPKDVCMGALRVTLTGNSEAWIENYRGILEYTGITAELDGVTTSRYVRTREKGSGFATLPFTVSPDFPSTIIPMKT